MSTDTKIALENSQLQKLELEIEKLKYDIQAQRSRSFKFERSLRFLPLVTTLLAVAGFWFTVNQYNQQQVSATVRLESDRKQSLLNPLWVRTLDTYFSAVEATASVASANSSLEREKAEAKFLQLYYGQLVLVENPDVEAAMIQFNRCVKGEDVCNESELKHRSLCLASAARKSIEEAFSVDLGVLRLDKR